jgi:hypothetical protein
MAGFVVPVEESNVILDGSVDALERHAIGKRDDEHGDFSLRG